jgi:hypothetical protein
VEGKGDYRETPIERAWQRSLEVKPLGSAKIGCRMQTQNQRIRDHGIPEIKGMMTFYATQKSIMRLGKFGLRVILHKTRKCPFVKNQEVVWVEVPEENLISMSHRKCCYCKGR